MTNIQWTDETWNPTTGCNKVSQGCKNCYAEKMHKRLQHIAPHKYTKGFSEGVETHEDELQKPLKWKKSKKIFVNSMSDLFHEDVPFDFIDRVFALMAICPQHTFQILTKRIERLLEWSKNYDGPVFPLSNVWIGTSVEDQQTANKRIPLLLQVPAAVRFLSCEPLLEWIDLNKYLHGIHWVIAGGESGHNARPLHPVWIRSIRYQCEHANIPFFFKQWGEWCPQNQSTKSVKIREVDATSLPMYKVGKSKSGNMLDGVQHMEFPK